MCVIENDGERRIKLPVAPSESPTGTIEYSFEKLFARLASILVFATYLIISAIFGDYGIAKNRVLNTQLTVNDNIYSTIGIWVGGIQKKFSRTSAKIRVTRVKNI